MKTLYELTEDYKELSELLYDEEADPESIGLACESIADDIKSKADGYARIIRNIDSDVESLKNEERRIANRRKSLENRSKYLKENLQHSMEVIGEKKFKTELFSFNIQNNPETAEILDEKGLIDWALVHNPNIVKIANPTVDKTELKKYMQEGNELEFARLTRSQSLRIR